MQAVTRVKLEQASKVKSWTPTRLTNGAGCTGREETPARERAIAATNKHLYRSTGVVSTACREGDLRRVGEARDWRGSRPRTSPERVMASLGVGEGHTTDEAGQRRQRKGPLLLVCLRRREGAVIDDESGNTE